MPKSKLFTLATTLLLILSSACSRSGMGSEQQVIQGPPGEDGKPGRDGLDGRNACTPPDPNLWLILRDFDEAERYQDRCWSDAQQAYEICEIKQSISGAATQCQYERDIDEEHCYQYTAWRVNKTVGRLCGAQILVWNGPGQKYAVDDVDTDGDGISNYREYLLHLNPCDAHSYGSCTADAELDGDFDGLPNGKDPDPYCNPYDKENSSDCI